MKGIFIFLGFVFALILLMMQGVSAVECNQFLNQSSGQCTVSSSLTLSSGLNKQINETAIVMNANNIVFDCNGSTIRGNHTNLSDTTQFEFGLAVNSVNNVTIKNCIVKDYFHSVKVYSDSQNISLTNNTFTAGIYNAWVDTNSSADFNGNIFSNSSNTGALFASDNNLNNSIITVRNSIFNQSLGYGFRLTSNISNFNIFNISNNGLINSDYFIFAAAGSNLIVDNITCNTPKCFYGEPSLIKFSVSNFIINNSGPGVASITTGGANNGIFDKITMLNTNNSFHIDGNNNITLKNSIFSNFTNPGPISAVGMVIIRGFAKNILIINNTFSSQDIGLTSYTTTNLSIINNTFYDNTKYTDGWGTGILIETPNNNVLIQGNIINYSDAGIFVRNSTNVNITNNTFNRELNSRVINRRDAASAIAIGELFITWLGDVSESANDNITKISGYKSNNITIQNNIFDSNTNVYLWLQGTTNLAHDLSNYWYKKVQFPTYLVDPTEFFINNNFDNITQINSFYGEGNTTRLGQGYMNIYKVYFNISKTYEYYTNINDTQNYTLALFNKTNALIYFSNNSVACSNIATCDDNINITLTPNNYSYVLDNFNVTEGVTRQFSPISISGTSTQKTITSTLSQSVDTMVIVDVAQCSFSAKYQGVDVNEDSCSNNVATFTLTDIPAGESVLGLTYLDINCSSNTSASIIIILAFCALSIVALTFILIVKFREGEFDVKILIIVFIAIIVGIVLFTQVAQLTGEVCS